MPLGQAHADEFPQLWIGASGGGQLIVTDLELDELDAISRPVGPDSSFYGELRFVLDLSRRWSVEVGAGYLPFDASAETNDGLDLAARVRWTFADVAVRPYVLLGAGSYVNLQPDTDAGTAFAPQLHYGIGIAPELADWVRLRVEVRHQLTDGLGDNLLGNALVGLVGFDFRIAGGPDEPEPAPEPVVVQEAPAPEAPPPAPEPEPTPEPPAPEPEPTPEPTPVVSVTCKRIEFDELVFFETDEHALRAQANPLLDEIARTLKARADVRAVALTGYADDRGTPAYNAALSRRRAESVKTALVNRGVEARRLRVKARGLADPRATNATDEGRAQNRRVEFDVVEIDASATCPPKEKN